MKRNNAGFIYIPDWMQFLAVACMVVGFIVIVAGSIALLVWIINHIRFI
jgi:hypothetical protein